MNSDILELLRRENLWLEHPERWRPAVAARLPTRYVPRTAPALAELVRGGRPKGGAVLVIGPRQAGKSTWAWKQLESLEPRVLYVDCELRLLREWCRDPGGFLADLEGVLRRPAAIFLKEAQHLEDAGLFVKGLVDRGVSCPVLVTGSSSFHLHAKTRESLAGRARRLQLLPFSLAEVCQELAGLAPLLRAAAVRERMLRHAVVGGYPAVWDSAEPGGELAALLEAFVVRDASDLYRIDRPDAFRLLLGLAARQIGSPVKLSEWAGVAGIAATTVSTYLEILEESHVLVRAPVFVGGKRAELLASPKYYFVDCGLRNRLAGDLRPFDQRLDRGPLLENWVFSELHKAMPLGLAVHWWRTKSGAEVDFVIGDGARRVGIEVKAARETRPVLSRGARSFIEAYAPTRLLVANLGLEHTAEVSGTTVEWLHAADLVGRVRELLVIA
jgi:hypothetical protein